MVHVMLNPPKKARKGKKKQPRTGKKHVRRSQRVCMPKSELRRAKSLRRLKRKVLRRLPKRKLVCFSKASLGHYDSLKKFKHRYVGTKYGFAKHPYLRGGSTVPSPSFATPKAAQIKSVRPRSVGKSYLMSSTFPTTILGMGTPVRTYKGARKVKKSAPVRPHKGARKSKKGGKETGKNVSKKMDYISMLPVGSNPRGFARNYPLPTYAFNDAVALDGLRDGLTAGYRPSALKEALPVVGGLVANSVLSALTNKLVGKYVTLGDKWKNPVGLAVGLGTAGILSVVTRMLAPRYAKHVFLGALTQVAWDGYQNYVAPTVKKTLGLNGIIGDEDTFGLWCDECDRDGQPFDEALLSPSVRSMPAQIDNILGTVMPPAAMTMQAPPNVSADALTAKVNGKVVPVERVPAQPAMGDFLTPNQVASATSLGNTGDLSSYL